MEENVENIREIVPVDYRRNFDEFVEIIGISHIDTWTDDWRDTFAMVVWSGQLMK